MGTIQTPLLTAVEFCQMPRGDQPAELVRGVVVEANVPGFRHGVTCSRVCCCLYDFVFDHRLGRVLCNFPEVVTKRSPDTVRAADIAYYSFERFPKNTAPEVCSDISPDLIFEVLSPGNRWSEMIVKAAEYLMIGVRAVCVVDLNDKVVAVFRAERAPQKFCKDDEFSVPEILTGWKLPVSRFFED